MKNKIKAFLQNVVGYENYLFIFAIFKIYTLKFDNHEKSFMYFLKEVSAGMNVLDIGANIGVMTVLLAKEVKNGKVYAFEPMPSNFNILKKIVRFFDLNNVVLYNCALGDTTGLVEMATPVIDKSIGQGVSHVLHNTIEGYDSYVHKVKVPLKRLDDIEEIQQIRINAMKIDVENFENFVFNGATNILKTNELLICCELWDNENRKKSFQILNTVGYKPMTWNGSVLESFDEMPNDGINFIFKK